MNSSEENRAGGHRPETAYSICAGRCMLRSRGKFTGRTCQSGRKCRSTVSWMQRWMLRRAERHSAGAGDSHGMRKKKKKRSSQASWKTCCLGTPFPRSALFL
jgi:hypothetical protein